MRIVPEGFGCKTLRAFVVSAEASPSAVATAPGNVVTSPSLREVWGGFREDPGCITAGTGR